MKDLTQRERATEKKNHSLDKISNFYPASFLLLCNIISRKTARNFRVCRADGISQLPTRGEILTFTQNEKSPPQLSVISHARNIRGASTCVSRTCVCIFILRALRKRFLPNKCRNEKSEHIKNELQIFLLLSELRVFCCSFITALFVKNSS